MSQENTNELGHVVTNGVKLAGDALLAPGTSLILDGQIGSGIARVVVGFAARAFLGPVGWFVVAADAYTKSTTGNGLLDRVMSRGNNGAKVAPTPTPQQGSQP